MTDHPIIFSAPMVRALLGGRKTMTRRLAWKPCEEIVLRGIPPSPWQRVLPGARLWVRETFARIGYKEPEEVFYRADGEHQHMGTGRESNGNVTVYFTDCWERNGERRSGSAWKPAIHMPRWASRLTLTVTATKIEKLNDISFDDCIAEGIHKFGGDLGLWGHDPKGTPGPMVGGSPIEAFAHLWESLHWPGNGSWLNNPEVVALTFTVERRNIDAAVRRAAAE